MVAHLLTQVLVVLVVIFKAFESLMALVRMVERQFMVVVYCNIS